MMLEIILRVGIVIAIVYVVWKIVTSQPFKDFMLFAREKSGMVNHIFKQDNLSRTKRKKLARYMKEKRKLNDEIG